MKKNERYFRFSVTFGGHPHQESTTFFLGNSKLALPLPVTCKVAIKGVI
jgi:hypothetical protein